MYTKTCKLCKKQIQAHTIKELAEMYKEGWTMVIIDGRTAEICGRCKEGMTR